MTMEVLSDCAPISDAVNNNAKHMDCMNQPSTPSGGQTSAPLCIGCKAPITDQYVMKVHPDLSWHMSCLKCSECNRYLDENCTCFLKDGRIFCKADYQRLFTKPCSKCGLAFQRADFVMRAEDRMYHIDCFQCTACSRQLMPGDEFAVREGSLYCREDNAELERGILNSNSHIHNNNHMKVDKQRQGSLLDNHGPNKMKRIKDGKPTRVRTVLSEKQLHTLRTCYGANPRPDALMKEQLVEMTGLSPRVIRVWFQNKRCKDKKKSMLLKHMQQQEKSLPMQGVPMVAQSPLHHADNGLQSIDSYHHQSWKRIPDFPAGQHEEINHNSFSSLMGSLYQGGDDTAVYLGDDDYMDTVQPGSVSSQFSRTSTSPNSSG